MGKWLFVLLVVGTVGCGFDARPLQSNSSDLDDDVPVDERVVDIGRSYADAGGAAGMAGRPNTGAASAAGSAGKAGSSAEDGSVDFPKAGRAGESSAGAGGDTEPRMDAAAPPTPPADSGTEDATEPTPDAAPPPDAATAPGRMCESCSSANPCAGELHCLQLTTSPEGVCLALVPAPAACKAACEALPRGVPVFMPAGLQYACAPLEGDLAAGCAGFLADNVCGD